MHLSTLVPEPSTAFNRIVPIDALRGLALFGVLAVNVVTEFRASLFEQFLENRPTLSASEEIAREMVSIGLEFKAICIFSLLFGLGLAMLAERLTPTGRSYYWLGRRLLVLLCFGLIHLVFIWNGDILTEYAVVGFIALLLLGLPPKTMAMVSGLLLAAYAAMSLFPAPLPLAAQDVLQVHVTAANSVYPSAGLLDVWRFSVKELPLLLPLHVYILPRTLALFLLGALAWRLRVIQWVLEPQRSQTRVVVVAATTLFTGLGMTVVYALAIPASLEKLKPPIWQMAPVVLAIGYCALFFVLWRTSWARKALAAFAPVGRMAFSNYIMQSLVCDFFFFGYGLGFYGRWGIITTLGFVFVLYACQTLLSTFWLHRFHYGPLEWLWRALMYGRKPSMLRVNGPG